ncbi:MAG: GNAT family N-acetyltransferase [Firmicutes bacterium]|nr:GNAT family N-acetyltransferase [Bacillota bacterium]
MKIVELSETEYKNYELDYKYQTRAYFDISIKKKNDIRILIKRKKLRKKQDKGFLSHLFEDHIENSRVFAIFEHKKMIAVIEGSIESWNNRYRVWNFLVDKKYRGEGYGQMLFQHIEKVAKDAGARAIILEVQSCNDPAIGFYIKQGLYFVGLNTMEYSNDDIQNKEVRLEMGKRL